MFFYKVRVYILFILLAGNKILFSQTLSINSINYDKIIYCDNLRSNLSITISGGTPKYRYTLIDAKNDRAIKIDISSSKTQKYYLSEGSYKINIRDNNGGNITSNEITITSEKIEVVKNINNTTCKNTSEGSAIFTITGGLPPYSIFLRDNSSVIKRVTINNSGESVSFSNLRDFNGSSKRYYLNVTDNKGCTFSISSKEDIYFTKLEVTPFYCDSKKGIIDISVHNTIFSHIIDSNGDREIKPSTFNNITFSDLDIGDYKVEVYDINGCKKSSEIKVKDELLKVKNITVKYNCDNNLANINFNLQGGVPNFNLNLINGENNLKNKTSSIRESYFNDLPSGKNYKILITDGNNCKVQTDFFSIENIKPMEIIDVDKTNLSKIEISVEGGKVPYLFSSEDFPPQESNILYDLGEKSHTITIKDSTGCEKNITFEVVFEDIQVRNFFSPNGDGINDFWQIRLKKDKLDRTDEEKIEDFKKFYPNAIIYLYVASSMLIYSFKGKNNIWDGKNFNGKDLINKIIWYSIHINNKRNYTGVVKLLNN